MIAKNANNDGNMKDWKRKHRYLERHLKGRWTGNAGHRGERGGTDDGGKDGNGAEHLYVWFERKQKTMVIYIDWYIDENQSVKI